MSSSYSHFDEYGYRFFPAHLIRSGQDHLLIQLLFDFSWMQAKLVGVDIRALVDDYPLAISHLENEGRSGWNQEDTKALATIHRALLLSVHVLENNKTQLATQLVSRLSSYQSAAISMLVEKAGSRKGYPWLKPLYLDKLPGLIGPQGSLLGTMIGHTDAVNSIAVSGDGQMAATASRDQTLRIWDLRTLSCINVLTGHTDEVNAVAFVTTQAGPILVSGAGKPILFKAAIHFQSTLTHTDRHSPRDTTIKLWDPYSGKLIHTFDGHRGAVRCFAFYDHFLFSGSDDQTIRIWDLEQLAGLGILGESKSHITKLDIMDAYAGLLASSETTFELWNLATGQGTGSSHCDPFWQNILTIDPNRLLLAIQEESVNGDLYTLIIWDVQNSQDGSEKMDRIYSSESAINAACFLNDSKEILMGGKDQILRLVNTQTREVQRSYAGHNDEIACLQFVPQTGQILSGSADGRILLWDLKGPSSDNIPMGHSDDVNAIAITADGKFAVSGSHDRSIMVWNARDGSRLRELRGHNLSVTGVAVGNTGNLLASCSNDHSVRLWDPNNGKMLKELNGHAEAVNCITFTHDDKYIISASADGILKVWDFASGREQATLTGHDHAVRALAAMHKNNVVASGDESGRILFWDLEQRRIINTIEAFHDDQKLKETREILWDSPIGPQWRPSKMEMHIPSVENLAFTPDDRNLVIALRDSTIVVWNVDEMVERYRIHGQSGAIYGVAASPDGTKLTSVSDDHTLKIWDMMTGVELCSFTADSGLYCCAIGPDSKTICVGEGDHSGRIHFFHMEGVD